MADPVLLTVWRAIVAALEAIATSRGDSATVRLVTTDLVSLLQLSPMQCPALMVMTAIDGGQRRPRLSCQLEERLVFQIEGRIDAPGLAADTRVEVYARFLADIERALTRDPTHGGVAVSTLVLPPKGPFMGIGDNAGTMLFTQGIQVLVVREYGAS